MTPVGHRLPLNRQRFCKALQVAAGVDYTDTILFLCDGSFLLKSTSARETEALLLLGSLLDCPIQVVRHPRLNASKGTVYSVPMLEVPVEELQKDLARYGVVRVRWLPQRRNGASTPSTHGFLMASSPPPVCPRCRVALTVLHILSNCLNTLPILCPLFPTFLAIPLPLRHSRMLTERPSYAYALFYFSTSQLLSRL